jgi:alpha-glucosidase
LPCGVPQVVFGANFTAHPQTADPEMPGAGLKAGHLKTWLKSAGVADPASLDQIELPPFGVYIGQIE